MSPRKRSRRLQYYAVAEGRTIGIFLDWNLAHASTDKHPSCCHKGFVHLTGAVAFLESCGIDKDSIMMIIDDKNTMSLADFQAESDIDVTDNDNETDSDNDNDVDLISFSQEVQVDKKNGDIECDTSDNQHDQVNDVTNSTTTDNTVDNNNKPHNDNVDISSKEKDPASVGSDPIAKLPTNNTTSEVNRSNPLTTHDQVNDVTNSTTANTVDNDNEPNNDNVDNSSNKKDPASVGSDPIAKLPTNNTTSEVNGCNLLTTHDATSAPLHANCADLIRDLERTLVNRLCGTIKENYDLKAQLLQKELDISRQETAKAVAENAQLSRENARLNTELKKYANDDKLHKLRSDLEQAMKKRNMQYQTDKSELQQALSKCQFSQRHLEATLLEKDKVITSLNNRLSAADLKVAKAEEAAYEAKRLQTVVSTDGFITVGTKRGRTPASPNMASTLNASGSRNKSSPLVPVVSDNNSSVPRDMEPTLSANTSGDKSSVNPVVQVSSDNNTSAKKSSSTPVLSDYAKVYTSAAAHNDQSSNPPHPAPVKDYMYASAAAAPPSRRPPPSTGQSISPACYRNRKFSSHSS